MKIRKRSLIYYGFSMVFALGCTWALQLSAFSGAITRDLNFLLLGAAFFINLWAIYHYTLHEKAGLACLQASYFNAFGMVLPGIIYLSVGLLPWLAGFRILNDYLIFQTALLILLSSVAMHAGILRGLQEQDRLPRVPSTLSETTVFWVLLVGFLICLAVFAWVGPDVILKTRGEVSNGLDEDSGTFGVFKRISLVLFALALIAGYLARNATSSQNQILFKVMFVIMAVTLLTFVNPMNSARWRIVGFVTSFVLVFFPFDTARSKAAFLLLLVFGTIIIYPLVGVISRSASQWDTLTAGQWQEFFAAGDFDGLQDVMQGIYYANEVGISWGKGIVDAIFAFVPNALWPDKPYHSGRLAAELVGNINLNLAMPLPGEAFMNFSWFGIFAMYFVGNWIAAFDRKVRLASGPSFSYFLSLVMAGSALFISRGALMAALEFIGLIMLTVAIVLGLGKFGGRRRG